ncbi:hypothetical protein VOLCADRAFT_104909, partial [Volvox carteri f. nagariensis]
MALTIDRPVPCLACRRHHPLTTCCCSHLSILVHIPPVARVSCALGCCRTRWITSSTAEGSPEAVFNAALDKAGLMAKPLRVPASALVTNQPFTTRSLTRKASIAESVLCPGLRGPELAALYGSDLQGVMQRSDVECATAHDRDIVDWLPELEEDKLEGFLDTAPPAYYGESDCIRSTLCAVVVQPGGGPCAACRELGVDKKHKLLRKAQRAQQRILLLEQGLPALLPTSLLSTLGRAELLLRLQAALQHAQVLLQDLDTARRSVAANAERTRPALVDELEEAFRSGRLEHGSVFASLMRGAVRGDSRRGRQLDHIERAFYLLLLQMGGPIVVKFVAANFNGPHLRTIQRSRASQAYFRVGPAHDDANIKGVLGVLTEFNQHALPLVISEDASALSPRLDTVHRHGAILAYGMCGGSEQVDAHSVYVPVRAVGTDNKDTAPALLRNIDTLDKSLEENGAVPMAHVGDGAASFRRQAIHPTKKLLIGPYLINPNILVTMAKEGEVDITASDLDYADKQNQSATMKLSDHHVDPKTRKVVAVDSIRAAIASRCKRSPAGGVGSTADGTYYGTYLFHSFFHMFTGVFYTDAVGEPAVAAIRAYYPDDNSVTAAINAGLEEVQALLTMDI